MTTLKDRRDELEDLAEALVFIDELIEQIEHPKNVPVLTISAEKVESFMESQEVFETVDQALVEDIASALTDGGFLIDMLDEALDTELYNRYTHQEDGEDLTNDHA